MDKGTKKQYILMKASVDCTGDFLLLPIKPYFFNFYL